MSLRVVMISDDEDLRPVLMSSLESKGFRTTVCREWESGLKTVQETLPDVVVLESRLSAAAPVDLYFHIGQLWGIPLMVLLDEGSEPSVPDLLLRGADFCMVRPLSLSECVARLKTLTRRQKNPVQWVRRFLNPEEHSVDANKRVIVLTPTQYRLLAYMMLNVGRVIPSQELITAIWPGEQASQDSLKFHISQLRHKLGDRATRQCISSQRGVGYLFSGNHKAEADERLSTLS